MVPPPPWYLGRKTADPGAGLNIPSGGEFFAMILFAPRLDGLLAAGGFALGLWSWSAATTTTRGRATDRDRHLPGNDVRDAERHLVRDLFGDDALGNVRLLLFDWTIALKHYLATDRHRHQTGGAQGARHWPAGRRQAGRRPAWAARAPCRARKRAAAPAHTPRTAP